jgi:hypothetical protein
MQAAIFPKVVLPHPLFPKQPSTADQLLARAANHHGFYQPFSFG